MNIYTSHYVAMARIENRAGVRAQKQGRPFDADVHFTKRKILMEWARRK